MGRSGDPTKWGGRGSNKMVRSGDPTKWVGRGFKTTGRSGDPEKWEGRECNKTWRSGDPTKRGGRGIQQNGEVRRSNKTRRMQQTGWGVGVSENLGVGRLQQTSVLVVQFVVCQEQNWVLIIQDVLKTRGVRGSNRAVTMFQPARMSGVPKNWEVEGFKDQGVMSSITPGRSGFQHNRRSGGCCSYKPGGQELQPTWISETKWKGRGLRQSRVFEVPTNQGCRVFRQTRILLVLTK